jgi:hypothetical protein
MPGVKPVLAPTSTTVVAKLAFGLGGNKRAFCFHRWWGGGEFPNLSYKCCASGWWFGSAFEFQSALQVFRGTGPFLLQVLWAHPCPTALVKLSLEHISLGQLAHGFSTQEISFRMGVSLTPRWFRGNFLPLPLNLRFRCLCLSLTECTILFAFFSRRFFQRINSHSTKWFMALIHLFTVDFYYKLNSTSESIII